MSFSSHLNDILEKLLSSNTHHNSNRNKQLIHCLDLTLLDEHAHVDSLAQLSTTAKEHQVAAVCVYLQHLHELTLNNHIATVINFPHGEEALDSSLVSIEKAAQLGAVEIDYVMPYRMYLEGEKQKALNQCHTVAQLCQHQKLLFKIIVETGAFPDTQSIYNVSHELIDTGCDFIKTSTGKITVGATLDAEFTILSAIKETHAQCGIKISGGIKTPQQAYNYAFLAELILNKPIDKSWFRIGASSLLDELLKTL